MKKILVLFMLLMAITANCFASSINQEFENTNIEQVKHGIVKAISIFSAKTNLVEKDDNTIVLFNMGQLVDIFSSEPATFVIVQDGIEKTIVVEPDKINAIGVK